MHDVNAFAGLSNVARSVARMRYFVAKMRSEMFRASLLKASVAFKLAVSSDLIDLDNALWA